MSERQLTRSETDRLIAGICGGIAEYLTIDPVLVRILFFFLIFASGIGILIYLILWFIMPREQALGSVGTAILQDNIDDMGHTLSTGANRLGRPGTVGAVMILLGGFFLFQQLGWIGFIPSGIFWPLLIVGIGVYMLRRR